MEDYRWDMDDQPEFTVGKVQSPEIKWGDSPNDYIKLIGGALGAPGLARAGVGMLGGAIRAMDPVEKMFRTNPGMLRQLLMRRAQAGAPMQMASRPSGAGARRDKKLRDAEDEAVKFSDEETA